MLLSKLVKFKNIHAGSYFYFEKAVNDAVGDLQRLGAFIVSVRLERFYDKYEAQKEKEEEDENSGDGDYWYALIVYNTERRMKGPIEDHSKPITMATPFEPGVTAEMARAQQKADVTKYRGFDMRNAPIELQAIAERLITGKTVGRSEYDKLEEYVTQQRLP